MALGESGIKLSPEQITEFNNNMNKKPRKIQYINPNPNCPDCFGTGEVYDIVPYGSTTAQLPSFCSCVEERCDEDTDEIIIVTNQGDQEDFLP